MHKIYPLIFFTILLIQINTDGYVGHVSYFHAKYVEIVSQNQLEHFKWLPFTTYEDNFADHHYLWHEILEPFFLIFGDVGFKIYLSLTITLFVYFFYLFASGLMELNKKYLIILILFLLFGCGMFFYRIMMMRVQSLSLCLLFLGLYFLFTRNKYLFIVSFFFPWVYTGFFILPLVSFIIVIIIDRKNIKYWLIQVVIPSLLGFIFNPTFPGNLFYIYDYITMHAYASSSVTMNQEYLGFTIFQLFIVSPLIVLNIIYNLIFIIKTKVLTKEYFLTLVLFVVFLLLTLLYRRFIEYFYPFLLLNLFYCVNNVSLPKKGQLIFLPFVLFLTIGQTANYYTYINNKNETERNVLFEAAEYLHKYIKENEIIYNAAWSDFDFLFYKLPECRYVCGLDPKYLERNDKYKFLVYNDPTKSVYFENKNYLHVLKKEFDADYCVFRKEMPSYTNFIANSVYDDSDIILENSDIIVLNLEDY